jgi:hypothetical protein
MLADELRLEVPSRSRGRRCAGHRIGQHRLGALAVAVVGRSPFGFGLPRRVAQVVAHLGTQRPLKNGLLELLEDAFQFGWRHWPGNELLKQLG